MKTSSLGVFLRLTVITVALLLTSSAVYAGGKIAIWGDNTYGQTVLPNGLKNIRAIAAGSGHSLALRADGTVVTWGWNNYGLTSLPTNLNSIISIAAGGYVSMALRANGTPVVWGNNSYGQTNVPSDLSRVIALATGGTHCLALKADGTVRVWGGLPSTAYSNTNLPAGLSGVTAVAAGDYHSLALIADGTVVAWGNNSWGQTNVPAGLTNVIAIAAISRHSLALKADGTVVAWGYSPYGQTNVPPDLSDVVAIAAGAANLALKADGTLVSWGDSYSVLTNLPSGISNVTAIACGGAHNLALVSDGPPEILSQPTNMGVPYQSNLTMSVTATGYEPLGWQWYFNGKPLTNSTRITGVATSSLSISNAQFSDIGNYTVIVSNAFGAVQSSGAVLTVISPPIITAQPTGQTVVAGTNITLNAAAIGTPPLAYQWLRDDLPVDGATSNFLSLTNIQSSQGGNYSLVVSNAYGTTVSSTALVTVVESAPYILTQPTNAIGYLGGSVGFAVNARGSLPIRCQWRFNGVDLPGQTNITLTLGPLHYDQAGYYSVALSNAFGEIVSTKVQLSVRQIAIWGTSLLTTPSNVPQDLTNLTAIAAGGSFLLGLKDDGRVSVLPVVPLYSIAPTNIPANLSNVTAIAAGTEHCLALRSNGTVVSWGGSGSIIRPPYPYPVNLATNVPAGLSNVIAVAAGDYHSVALQRDGKVLAWGAYVNTYLQYKTATNVPPGLSNVIAIAAGGSQNLALKSDGRVVAWGSATNVPGNLSNVIAIACADSYNLALQTSGKVVAWAANLPPVPFPIGRGTFITNVPPNLSNVVAIAAGYHAMALKSDGSIGTWSSNTLQSPANISNFFAIAVGGSFSAALAGNGSPHLTVQPASQTVTNGANVRLSVRAVGVQPTTYQWQLDGAPLANATNADLLLLNVHGNNSGAYQVNAANALGIITSLSATLTIPFSTNLAAALDATNLVWTTTPANAPWFAQNRVTHDNEVAAQSGRISHNQQSILQATVVGPGTLTFWWKVSSEEAYDRLWFSMDALNWAAWLSGEKSWQLFTYPIPAGTHTLRWAYTKDGTVTAGQDAGWVDQVVFTPATPLTLTAPRPLVYGGFTFKASAPGGCALLPEQLSLFEVQASTNLRDWTMLSGVCTLTNGALQICDPSCTNYPQRFYRVIQH